MMYYDHDSKQRLQLATACAEFRGTRQSLLVKRATVLQADAATLFPFHSGGFAHIVWVFGVAFFFILLTICCQHGLCLLTILSEQNMKSYKMRFGVCERHLILCGKATLGTRNQSQVVEVLLPSWSLTMTNPELIELSLDCLSSGFLSAKL